MAGLRKDQIERLKLKWAFGIPGGTAMRAQATIAGGRLFFGSEAGDVYSIDAASGCIYWVFHAGGGVRTAITIGMISSGPNAERWAAYFGGSASGGATAYAVDGGSGRLLWEATVDDSRFARITGAPAVAAGTLYVPVTGDEDARTWESGFECCRFRGSLVALDAQTGHRKWKTYTIAEPARLTGMNREGVQQWGPSGAGIWSAPTVDAERRLIYVGTGDSHSEPVVATSDAILAFDMNSGAMVWSRQMTTGDVFNSSCVEGDPADCPQAHGFDFDFGASPILVNLPGGKRSLIAGQKSGIVHALDPDNRGAVLWQTRLGRGGAAGGIQWGPAVDGQRVYAALSDAPDAFPGGRAEEISRWFGKHLLHGGGGMFALKLINGERVWYTRPQCGWVWDCSAAQIAAVTHIPGIVFSGSVDGRLRAYSTDNGQIMWSENTVREYHTVNGVAGRGGGINGPGPVVAGGVVYVNSGYPGTGGRPGNVLLAFSVDGK
jgi:polyvinyl alcohol dehydrogenase (cytochrome)